MNPCAVPDGAHTLLFGARKVLLALHTAAAVVWFNVVSGLVIVSCRRV